MNQIVEEPREFLRGESDEVGTPLSRARGPLKEERESYRTYPRGRRVSSRGKGDGDRRRQIFDRGNGREYERRCNAEHGCVEQTGAWTKNSRLTALLIR
jgi:hypothetical protein